jgi:hypothetical protein
VEVSNIDSAIWAVNINRLIDQLSKNTDYDLKKEERTFEGIIERNNDWAGTVITKRKNENVVFVVEPFQQHERIAIQQGLFLFPGNIEMPFEYNLCSVFEFDFKDLITKSVLSTKFSATDKLDFSNSSIIKIVIPSTLHSKVLSELYNMNVTAATLFPGLDGFARSLSFRFSQLDYFINYGD